MITNRYLDDMKQTIFAYNLRLVLVSEILDEWVLY